MVCFQNWLQIYVVFTFQQRIQEFNKKKIDYNLDQYTNGQILIQCKIQDLAYAYGIPILCSTVDIDLDFDAYDLSEFERNEC